MSRKKSNFEIYGDVIPDTQRAAWNAIYEKCAEMDFKVLLIIAQKGRANWELCQLTGRPAHSISGSISRLADMGFIIDSGARSMNPKSGKGQIVWIEN